MPRTRWSRMAPLGAVVAAVVLLTGADRNALRALPILRPGSHDLDVSHIRERSDSTAYSVTDTTQPGSPKVTLYRHDEEHLINDASGPAVLLINSARGYIDSAIVLKSSLRPIREIQNYFTRHRRLVFDYKGNRVIVRDSSADSGVRVREHTYDGNVFHFNELNLVIRSLPLREGYEAVLPLYSEGSDALEMDSVRVIGKNDQGAWMVRFADPVVIATRTIDPGTRRIISSTGGRRDAR